MYFIINERISNETVDKVIGLYNSLELKQGEPLIIYLTSRGGDVAAMEVLLDILDYNAPRTTIIAASIIASAAFELYFKTTCKKRMINGCIGMYHQGCTNVEMNSIWKPEYDEDKEKQIYMKNYMFKSTLSLCEYLGFSEKEMKAIKKGKDVWFQPDRMMEFFQLIK